MEAVRGCALAEGFNPIGFSLGFSTVSPAQHRLPPAPSASCSLAQTKSAWGALARAAGASRTSQLRQPQQPESSPPSTPQLQRPEPCEKVRRTTEPPASTPTAPPSQVKPCEKVQALLDMGFGPEGRIMAALEAANGSAERAAEILLGF